jgi:PPOX class probable F420-dependent enzyme
MKAHHLTYIRHGSPHGLARRRRRLAALRGGPPEMTYTDTQLEFLSAHRWAVLATGRLDGSPQQAMVGYALDDEGRVLVLTRSFTAKWRNALRQPRVSLTVPDGRRHVVVYGTAEAIDTDPERAELSADVLAAVRGTERPVPSTIVDWLDENRQVVLRITPEKALIHE